MIPTISGVIVGIVIAAAVTVLHGEAFNRIVREQFRSPLTENLTGNLTGNLTEVALPSGIPQKDPVVEDSLMIEAPSEVDIASADEDPGSLKASILEQRWSDFASDSGSLKAVGEFQWRECFVRAAAVHGVSESLLLAVASGESGFDPAARSDKNAVGLMQIQWPGTAQHLGISREADLYDPCTNVAAGARYLVQLTERYAGDLYRAIAAYNYGPGRIDEGDLPAGAQWYSQYIYQHLQRVLGRDQTPTSELIPRTSSGASGHEVLMLFNQQYRARDFLTFLNAQVPGLRLAQRSEVLGQYEIVLLFDDQSEREVALETIRNTGLVALAHE